MEMQKEILTPTLLRGSKLSWQKMNYVNRKYFNIAYYNEGIKYLLMQNYNKLDDVIDNTTVY